MTALVALRGLLIASLDAHSPQDLERMYARHTKRLRFDERMVTANPHREAARALKAVIDAPVSAQEVRQMVLGTERAVARSPLLVNGLEALFGVDGRAVDDHHQVLADVLMYALLLERVTRAAELDSPCLRALLAHFKQVRAEVDWRRHAPLFLTLKLGSVEGPAQEIADALVRGHTAASFWQWKLRENILEATVSDLVSGHLGNALMGLSLLWDRARDVRLNGRREVCFEWPDAQRWVERYTAWNLAFVCRFANFPYVMAKLLIPSVLDCHQRPQTYLHRRTIALYLQVHWGIFMRHEYQGGVEMDWSVLGSSLQRRWSGLNFAALRGRL